MNRVDSLIVRLRDFAEERDWNKFHSPKNLSMALSGEVGELLEHFQWLTEEESFLKNSEDLALVEEEIADVFIYLLRLSDQLGICLLDAADKKVERNAEKYPIELSLGSHLKYDRLNVSSD